MNNKAVSKNLLAMIVIVALGMTSLIASHKVFLNISDNLDKKLKNAESRNQIGESILGHLSSIEANFYRLALSKNNALVNPLKDDILTEISYVKQALDVLSNGGTITTKRTLNIASIENYTVAISYHPEYTDNKISIESIDLLPKLTELESQAEQLTAMLKSYDKGDLADIMIKEIEYSIRIFTKVLPTNFIRMKENASRLMYQSRQEVENYKQSIYREKNKYTLYEAVISFVVMVVIFILWYITSRQISKTNSKLMESSVRLKELAVKAEDANKAKSAFLANMSHEIRTPLNSIIGFSEVLSAADLPVQEKDYAGIVTRSAKSLLSIINDILDISKIESGNIELTKEPFEPAAVFDQTVELFSVKAHGKSIRFSYEYDTNIPKGLLGDYFRIQQVISNLLSNAIKFTPDRGEINFKIEQLAKDDKKSTLLFSVKDSGIGISEQGQKDIFKPFTQADNSITKLYGGTGLGLAICEKLINLMGSKIEINSRLSAGSEFSFILSFDISTDKPFQSRVVKKMLSFSFFTEDADSPNIRRISSYLEDFGKVSFNSADDQYGNPAVIFCTPEKNFEMLTKASEEYPETPLVLIGNISELPPEYRKNVAHILDYPIYGSKIFNIISTECGINDQQTTYVQEEHCFKGTVLVAEDNPSNQLLIKILLNKMGLEADIVSNGKEAVEKYTTGDYNLILMDVNMPVMDGLAATSEIVTLQKQLNTSKVPIIALTANAVKGDREKYLAAGMQDYLSKPVSKEQLWEMVDTYCKCCEKDLRRGSVKKAAAAEWGTFTTSFDKKRAADNMGLDIYTYEMLADNFFLTIKSDIKELETYIKEKNAEKIAAKVHYIKGACINLGMKEPAVILSEIGQEPSNSNSLQRLSEIFDKIHSKIH